MSPWAVRDMAHGKVYHFQSWEEMVAWIVRVDNTLPDASVNKQAQVIELQTTK